MIKVIGDVTIWQRRNILIFFRMRRLNRCQSQEPDICDCLDEQRVIVYKSKPYYISDNFQGKYKLGLFVRHLNCN